MCTHGSGGRQRYSLQKESRALPCIPSRIMHTEEYKRLKFCRYADDFVIGIIGTKHNAETIKQRVIEFLRYSLKGVGNNKISQGCQAKEMSTNHFSRSGRREIFSSKASIAFLASFTPVWYVFVISLTVGGLPFHVIVRAKFSAVSMVSSKLPFQWFSKTPNTVQ